MLSKSKKKPTNRRNKKHDSSKLGKKLPNIEASEIGPNPYGYKTWEEAGINYEGDPEDAALDITVDTSKPMPTMDDTARAIADIPAGTVLTNEIADAIIANILFEHQQNGPTQAYLNAGYEPERSKCDAWQDSEGRWMKWNVEDGMFEEVPAPECKPSAVIAIIIVTFAFMLGIGLGYLTAPLRTVTVPIYRNATQTYDLRANPFGANKIELKPGNITITRP